MYFHTVNPDPKLNDVCLRINTKCQERLRKDQLGRTNRKQYLQSRTFGNVSHISTKSNDAIVPMS